MKYLLLVVGVLFLVACGNKTKNAMENADSIQQDSAMMADGESPKIWSVEAVEAQIRVCFEEVNKKAVDYPMDIIGLDKMFCSRDFLELEEILYKKNRENEVMFEDDNGHHWLASIASPSQIDSIRTELLTDNQAQAEVWLSDKYGRNGYLNIVLYLEDGVWKIHDWIDDEMFETGSLYNWMQSVVDNSDNLY